MPGRNPTDFDWGGGEADDLPSEEEANAIAAGQYDGETGMRIEQPEETPVESVVEEIYQEQPAPKQIDKALERIQKAQERLDIAACYRLLLNGSLFESNTPAARKVDGEIREFVCQRLEILMGVQPEVKAILGGVAMMQAAFTDSEVKVLKALVKTVEKKMAEPKKEPEPESAPSLKKVSNETPTEKPAPPPAPAPKQQPPPQRRQFPQPQLKRPVTNQQQPQKQPTIVGKVAIDNARVPPQFRDDPTLKFTPDGKVLVQARDADGKPIFEFNPATKKFDRPFYKNVALPARADPSSGVQAAPMPYTKEGIEQFMGPGSAVMQRQADSMLSVTERRMNKMGIGNQFAGTLVKNIAAATSDAEPEGEFQP